MAGFIGFLIGTLCGGFIGMLMMGLMCASSQQSRCEECMYKKIVKERKWSI